MSDQVGDPKLRYYVVVGARVAGQPQSLCLVEGVPDPVSPGDPGKDSRDGNIVVAGFFPTAWGAFNLAGFCWVDRGFKRYWIYNPEQAAKTRAGDEAVRGRPA